MTSSQSGVLRLWRMPKGKPLMELGPEEFLRNFLGLTNARVIADKNSATGYSIENAPFLGWKNFQ